MPHSRPMIRRDLELGMGVDANPEKSPRAPGFSSRRVRDRFMRGSANPVIIRVGETDDQQLASVPGGARRYRCLAQHLSNFGRERLQRKRLLQKVLLHIHNVMA